MDLAELEVDHALTCEFSTPHTPWARPYALGKTRVLFFTNGMGTAPRECVELIQRFDLTAQAVFWAQIVDTNTQPLARRRSRTLSHAQPAPAEMGLLRVSRRSGRAPWRPRNSTECSRPSPTGTGLVLAGANDTRVLKEKNRLTALPPFLTADRLADAYAVGAGAASGCPSGR